MRRAMNLLREWHITSCYYNFTVSGQHPNSGINGQVIILSVSDEFVFADVLRTVIICRKILVAI